MAATAAAVEEKLSEGQPRGFPFGDFDYEDVMLPDGDDLGVPSDDENEDEDEVVTDTGFGNVIGAHIAGRRCQEHVSAAEEGACCA